MTLNYNHALFRNLRPTLVADLTATYEEAGDVERGENDGARWHSLSGMRDMAGSLAMTGCMALESLTKTLVRAIERVQDAPSQGWTEVQTRQVAQAIGQLAHVLVPQVERLAERETVFPVRLYPQWKTLLERLNEPVPAPESLFEPDPEFGELTFGRMDKAYLAKVVRPAEVRLTRAIAALEEATEATEVSEALAKASEVFQWAANLHHRRAFHAYWVVVRARLAQAELDPAESLRQRSALLDLLRGAYVELKRFGADAPQMTHGRLAGAIAPLLAPWPPHWQHPALAELRQVFALDAFWAALADIQADPGQPSIGQQFDQRREDIAKAVGLLRETWEKWLVGTAEPSDVLRRQVVLVPLAPLFPQAGAADLIDRLDRVLAWSLETPAAEPDEAVIQEVAAALLALDDALDPRQQGQAELAEQLKLQNLRLDALMVPGRPMLGRLPVIRWGNARRRREAQEARRHSLQQVANDLSEVELRMDEILREEVEPKDVRDVLTRMVRQLGVGAAALEMLRLPLHARIQDTLLDHLDAMAGRPALLEDPAEHHRLAMVVPALTRAVLAEAEGQTDTEEMLMGVASTFLNDPLVGRTDVLPLEEPSDEPGSHPGPILSAVSPENDLPLSPPAVDLPVPAETDSATPVDEPPAERGVEGVANLPADASDAVTVEVQEEGDLRLDLGDVDDAPAAQAAVEEDEEEEEGETPAMTPADLGEALRSPQGYLEGITPDMDEELVEIYFAEVMERVSEMRLARDRLMADDRDEDALDVLRRAFHSIKGSGRLVELHGLGEMGFWGESFVRGIQARGEAYLPWHDHAVALLSQTLLLAIEELQEAGASELYGQGLWTTLHPEVVAGAPPVVPPTLEADPVEPAEDDFIMDLDPWEEPVHQTHQEHQDVRYDPHGGQALTEAQVPIDYDPVPVEPVSPPLSATESEWTVPEADAYVQRPAVISEATAPPRSALQEFLSDPESGQALALEWEQRREQLEAVVASGDGRDLELIAHTLRTLALMFDWPEWAQEFADVEGFAAHPMAPEEARRWAVRWLAVIEQAQKGKTLPWTDEVDEPGAEDPVHEEPSLIPTEAIEDEPVHIEPIEAEPSEPLGAASVDGVRPSVPAVDVHPDEVATTAPARESSSNEAAGVSDSHAILPSDLGDTLQTLKGSADASEDEIWAAVFAAFDQMMEGGRQLGLALERLADHRTGA